jgi:hypothetical protein
VANGGRTNAPLSLWDGKQWSVPAVFKGPSALTINDMLFVGNTLYAAGSFTNVGGVEARGLARWDGTNWSGVGVSGICYALAAEGGSLYVGGNFTNANGVSVTNVGMYDGSAWHALGAGIGSYAGYSVRALAVRNGQVYAGGYFTNSGAQWVTNLAVWNGTAWSGVGGALNDRVLALGFSGSDLYAGGYFTQAGSMVANGLARWDGTNWSPLGSGISGASAVVTSLAAFNGAVYVTGSFTNAGGLPAICFGVWNGSAWANAGDLSGAGYRVVANGDRLLVGGNFNTAGGGWVGLFASWQGGRWNAFCTDGRRAGAQDIVSALASDGTNLYAGGYFTNAGGTNVNYVACFDGNRWRPLGSGLNGRVLALAVTNQLVYAGGYFTGTTDGHALHYIGGWDGTNWNSLGDAGGVVYALAISSNGLYAAGTYYTGTAYGSPFFNRWDGSVWQGVLHFGDNTLFAVPLSDPVGYDAIAIQGTNIFLGGNIPGFTQFDPNVGFSPATNCLHILRFDGTYGWIMGTGLNKTNVALAVVGTNLYAAGLFTTAGGVSANQIARWDGNSWSGVGGGVVGNGTVLALAAMGNVLYAGGTFTNMGGVPASRVARWDGTNWSALGGGTSGTVQSLAIASQDLYVGGAFRVAGGKNANDISRWNEQINFNIPQLTNPSGTAGGFSARLLGMAGQTNLVLASTNLNTWTPVLTNSTGIYDFITPDFGLYRSRYYRAALSQ